MEHRWGQRSIVDVPVRLECPDYAVGSGRLTNVSISGGFIETNVVLPMLARVLVEVDLGPCGGGKEPLRIDGCVVRREACGCAIEWHDLAPEKLGQLPLLREQHSA